MRAWIPVPALAFSVASHGASWALAFYVAAWVGLGWSAPAMAWLHLVALGWFSMAALAVLVHAIPAFTDLQWSFERLARSALVAFAAGAVAFVLAWLISTVALWIGAATIVLALAAYFFAAFSTLAKSGASAPRERAIGRALALTFAFFAAAAVAGLVMALAFAGAAPQALLSRLAPAHATLALYGWLTMLVFGVSVRTIRPVSGAAMRFRWTHIAVGTLTLAGVLILVGGQLATLQPLVLLGAACLAGGTLAYVADAADTLARATVAHRPPQAFFAAALVWLVVATALGGGALLGMPWQSTFAFVFLVGWLGQMVNAHILHIGVRLIATLARGDDDETQPGELLDVRLSWLAFVAMQSAVVLCGLGLVRDAQAFVSAGALVGFAAWCVIIANLGVARARARHIPAGHGA